MKDDKVAAILSYFLVGIIWYFADEKIQKSSFAKFHVKQALNLLIINAIVNVAVAILFFVPFFIAPIINLLVMILWIIGLVNVINDKKKEIPVIGQFAKKYLTF